jgi:type I protein arginine methyltransferase
VYNDEQSAEITDFAQEKYRSALHELAPHRSVLDLGTGSGLHSLFAFQAGASRIVAVESSLRIRTARNVIRDNQAEHAITLIHGNSTKLELAERFDLIVSNLGLVSSLCYLADARDRFLLPHGTMVPSKIGFHVALCHCPHHFETITGWTHQPVWGLNLRALGSERAQHCYSLPLPVTTAANGPMEACILDFNDPMCNGSFTIDVAYPIRESTEIHGIGLWYELRLDPKEQFIVGPFFEQDHVGWYQRFFPLEEPVTLQPSDDIRLFLQATPFTAGWVCFRWNLIVNGVPTPEQSNMLSHLPVSAHEFPPPPVRK